MPLPKPNPSEQRQDFIERCMSDENIRKDFKDNAQRAAVCYGLWKDRKKDA